MDVSTLLTMGLEDSAVWKLFQSNLKNNFVATGSSAYTMTTRSSSTLDVTLKRICIVKDVAVQLQKDLNINKVSIAFNAQVNSINKPVSATPLTCDLLSISSLRPDGRPHPTNSEISSEVRTLQGHSLRTAPNSLHDPLDFPPLP
jgi:hypothetical protein